MRPPTPTTLAAGLAITSLAFLTTASPAHARSGTLEMYSQPGVNYTVRHLADGCHTFDARMVGYANTDPIGSYAFHSGPDCTGVALGDGRDETQWAPPLQGVRSVRLRFEG